MVSSAIIILLAVFFDLSQIAAIGALSMLMIHLTVHVGHLRLISQTGASRILIVTAVAANAAAILLGGWHLLGSQPILLAWIAGFFAASLLIEILLNRLAGRSIVPRADVN